MRNILSVLLFFMYCYLSCTFCFIRYLVGMNFYDFKHFLCISVLSTGSRVESVTRQIMTLREHQDHLVWLPGFWVAWLDRILFERWRLYCSAPFHYNSNIRDIALNSPRGNVSTFFNINLQKYCTADENVKIMHTFLQIHIRLSKSFVALCLV